MRRSRRPWPAPRLGATEISRQRVRPKGTSRDGKACPLFEVVTSQHGPRRDSEVHIDAFSTSGAQIGFMGTRPNLNARTLDIFLAGTLEPGCGVGTRLYEAAAREACSRDLRLRSDVSDSLSRFSQSFWGKQQKLQRAEYDRTEKRFVLNHCQVSLEGRGRK